MRSLYCVGLLIVANLFGHLQLKQHPALAKISLVGISALSWGPAFFECVFQVPANRTGSEATGGPSSLFELTIIQAVVSLTGFTLVTVYFSRPISWPGTTWFDLLS